MPLRLDYSIPSAQLSIVYLRANSTEIMMGHLRVSEIPKIVAHYHIRAPVGGKPDSIYKQEHQNAIENFIEGAM